MKSQFSLILFLYIINDHHDPDTVFYIEIGYVVLDDEDGDDVCFLIELTYENSIMCRD